MGMYPIWRTKQNKFLLLGIEICSRVKKNLIVLSSRLAAFPHTCKGSIPQLGKKGWELYQSGKFWVKSFSVASPLWFGLVPCLSSRLAPQASSLAVSLNLFKITSWSVLQDPSIGDSATCISPLFENESKCEAFHMEISFIHENCGSFTYEFNSEIACCLNWHFMKGSQPPYTFPGSLATVTHHFRSDLRTLRRFSELRRKMFGWTGFFFERLRQFLLLAQDIRTAFTFLPKHPFSPHQKSKWKAHSKPWLTREVVGLVNIAASWPGHWPFKLDIPKDDVARKGVVEHLSLLRLILLFGMSIYW